MKEYTILDIKYKDITVCNEMELLKGLISVMCETDDFKTLLSFRNYAISHIEHIYNLNYKRLTESDNEQ